MNFLIFSASFPTQPNFALICVTPMTFSESAIRFGEKNGMCFGRKKTQFEIANLHKEIFKGKTCSLLVIVVVVSF